MVRSYTIRNRMSRYCVRFGREPQYVVRRLRLGLWRLNEIPETLRDYQRVASLTQVVITSPVIQAAS